MSFRDWVIVPLRHFWQRVKPVLLFLDRCLVAVAVPFGVRIQPRLQRFGVLAGIYVILYLIGLLPVPLLALTALALGYLGVLAVGRAWVANEKLRTAIVKKLVNGDPDALPDLRGSALLSALQLLILFPLIFQRLQQEFQLFRNVPETAGFGTWFAFTFEWVSRTVLEWFGSQDPKGPRIEAVSLWGKLLVLAKRLTIDLILIQGILRLYAIVTTTREGVEALRQDADMTRRLGRRAVEPLIELLWHSDRELRARAAQVLGELRDARAVEPLMLAVGDADADVRWNVATALGGIGDGRAIEPLVRALHDPEPSIRSAAVEALAKVADRRAVPLLLEMAEGSDPSASRAAAIDALKRFGDTRAVEPLIRVLEGGEEEVRRAAAEALGELKDGRAVEPLIRVAADRSAPAWVRYDSVRALEQLDDDRAVEPLLRLLSDPDAFLRKCAIHALGKLGGSQAVGPLLAVLEDPAKEIREATALALGELADARAIEPLARLLRDTEEDVRAAAAQALTALKGPATVAVPLLRDGDRIVRRQAAELLGKLGDPAAIAPLGQARDDDDQGVREAAAWALEQLGQPRPAEPIPQPSP